MVEALRQLGYDVLFVMESMRGEDDEVLLAQAFHEERLLITEDKDFGELVYRLRLPTRGIILLRFNPGEEDMKIERLLQLLEMQAAQLFDTFIVVERNKVRLRPLQR